MRVEIIGRADGRATLKVDGFDLSHVVQAVDISMHATSMPRVCIHLVACEITIDAPTEAKLVEFRRESVEQRA